MGDFTSQYKVTDSYGVTRTETRVDPVKTVDNFAMLLMVVTVLAIGLVYSGFLWLIFKTFKEPKNLKFKEMELHGIDVSPIITVKRTAWIMIVLSLLIGVMAFSNDPVYGAVVAGLTFISGYILLFKSKRDLKELLALTASYSSFYNGYSAYLTEKKQLLNAAASLHGRHSDLYKQIANQELVDLVRTTTASYGFPKPIVENITVNSKALLDIPLTEQDREVLTRQAHQVVSKSRKAQKPSVSQSQQTGNKPNLKTEYKSKDSTDYEAAYKTGQKVEDSSASASSFFMPMPGKRFGMTVVALISLFLATHFLHTQALQQADAVSSTIYYADVKNSIQSSSFSDVFADNSALALDRVKAFEKSYLGMYIEALYWLVDYAQKISGELYLPPMQTEFFGSINSIEIAEAYKRVYGDEYKLNHEHYLKIVRNLGSLDDGYSKKLASFITKNMDETTVKALNQYDDFEAVLKQGNQMSALRAYNRLKKQYGVK